MTSDSGVGDGLLRYVPEVVIGVVGVTASFLLTSTGLIGLVTIWWATTSAIAVVYALKLRRELATRADAYRLVKSYKESTGKGTCYRVTFKVPRGPGTASVDVDGPYCEKDLSRMVGKTDYDPYGWDPRPEELAGHWWFCPQCKATVDFFSDEEEEARGRAHGRFNRGDPADWT